MMLSGVLDYFHGKAITVPPMDGPFRPNNRLEDAEVLLAIDAPDNLVSVGARLFFSAGTRLLALEPSVVPCTPVTVAEFAVPVTALAVDPRGTGLAVGLDDGSVMIRNDDGSTRTVASGLCPTALAFVDTETLIVCQGARDLRPSEWARDLMQKGKSGAVWKLDLRSGAKTQLAQGLAFPFGAFVPPEGGSVVVSESWRHRLLRLPLDRAAAPEPVLVNLPGYPARVSPAVGGGAWLALFAPRNRLIEFVLEEDGYRNEMVREVDPNFWIAPTLNPRRAFLEPLQCGAVRTMGIRKPWAPTRSYGLLVRLDQNFLPIASFHSRSDGTRHGITSAAETADSVFVTAKGGNAILRLAPSAQGQA